MNWAFKQKLHVGIILFYTLFWGTSNAYASHYGLRFKNNYHESERTGLKTTENDPFEFENQFDLEFTLRLIPNRQGQFGYISRLKFGNDQMIDIVLFRKAKSLLSINIVHKDKKLIEYFIAQEELQRNWKKFKIQMNTKLSEFKFSVDEKLISSSKLPKSLMVKEVDILFGADNSKFLESVDIPPIDLKDIKLYSNGKLKQWWPLDEFRGSRTRDKLTGEIVNILNPHWLYSAYLGWEMMLKKKWPGKVQIAYGEKSHQLMIVGRDSIIFTGIYQSPVTMPYANNQRHHAIYEGNIFFDTITKRLGSFYIKEKSASFYNFNLKEWSNEKPFKNSVYDYFFNNKFVCPLDTSLYIFNGYSDFVYENIVQRLDIKTQKWDTIPTKGDILPPRSLAALGSNRKGDTVYILGGFGSVLGEQMLNPQFFHDLHYYSVLDSSFGLIYKYDTIGIDLTFAESMIIDHDKQLFYALVLADSSLQLIEGSLKKPSFRFLGNPIPYVFNRTDSYQDLFYNPKTEKLICGIVQSKGDSSTVQLYTINFPPNKFPQNEWFNQEEKNTSVTVVLIMLFVLLVGFFFYKRRKANIPAINSERQKHYSQLKINTKPQRGDQPTIIGENFNLQVLVFGSFRIVNKQGENFSNRFSPLLQELFLLIFLNSLNGESVSKTEISQTLWPDKPLDSVRNNRAVNLAKLKKLIEEIESIDLIKSGDSWRIEVAEDVYSDYHHFVHFIEDNNEIDMVDINELLNVTRPGSFLADIQSDWMEETRSNIIYKLIDYYTAILQSLEINDNAELIIEIADTVIKFDLINEEALSYKCRALVSLGRQGLAKTAYNNFIKDYEMLYNETYEVTLKEILDGKL